MVEGNPNDLIDFLLLGSFPNEKVEIYRAAAEEIGVPFEIIPPTDERITKPNAFFGPHEGESVVLVQFGQRYGEFHEAVRRLSPPSLIQEPHFSPEQITDGASGEVLLVA